jgi:peptide/nickel transport system substrate-binding protein
MMKTAMQCLTALMIMGAGTSALAQKSQDRLRIAFLDSTMTVAPYSSGSAETIFLSDGIFDNLLSYDEEAQKYVPSLAKSYKMVNDRTIDFELRENVLWQDGEKFDADDVIFTLEWILNPKTKLRRRANWDFIDRVEKFDSHKVRIVTKAPTPNLLESFAYATYIFPEHFMSPMEDKDLFGTKPVGTGMYRAQQFDRNSGAILIKNPDYKHGGTAKPANNIYRVDAVPVPDKGTQIAHVLRGELELLRNAQLEQAEDLAKDPRFRMTLKQGLSYIYLMFDAAGRSGLKAVQDPRVRKALMMAVNREEVYKIRAGNHELPWGVPNALCWDFQDSCSYSQKPPAYDPDGAKKLLAEAGYPNGFEIKISATNTVKDMAEVVVGQLRKVGVRASLDSLTAAAFHAKQTNGEVNALITGWSAGGGPDVARTLNFFFEPGALDYIGDERLHKLADMGVSIADETKRKPVINEIMTRVNEMSYIIPVAPIPVVFLHSSDVKISPRKSFDIFGVSLSNLNWN